MSSNTPLAKPSARTTCLDKSSDDGSDRLAAHRGAGAELAQDLADDFQIDRLGFNQGACNFVLQFATMFRHDILP
jgi:hypothetical protein